MPTIVDLNHSNQTWRKEINSKHIRRLGLMYNFSLQFAFVLSLGIFTKDFRKRRANL